MSSPLPELSAGKGHGASVDEKLAIEAEISSSVSIFDLKEGDAALQLEFNTRLRRRLVSQSNIFHILIHILKSHLFQYLVILQICAVVYFTQFLSVAKDFLVYRY